MDKYARIRDNNLKEQTRRFCQVTNEFADIRELITTRKELQSGFDLVLSSDEDFTAYTKKIRRINADIRKALEKHGLPANYLEPIFNCPICEDKGYYYENGVTPKRCKCNTDLGFGCSFDDFNKELFSKEKPEGRKTSPYEHISATLAFSKEYCARFPDNIKPNILFYGSSGLGKSFLASCICSELKNRGFFPVKVNAFKLIEDFRDKHVKDTPYPADYYGCDFLVIDDIGTEPMYNNITVEYLFALINERIENKRATLFVTNQSFENCCKRYDERLASRMFDSMITERIAFFGENLRLKKK